MHTTWNMEGWDDENEEAIPVTPTDITDFEGEYSTNYNDIVSSSGKNYFLGVITNGSNQITRAFACGLKDNSTPFCIEGDADGTNYGINSSFINGPSLWNNTCTAGSALYDNSINTTDCGSLDGSSVSASAFSDGGVYAGVSDVGTCWVSPEGMFVCSDSDPISPTPPPGVTVDPNLPVGPVDPGPGTPSGPVG